MLYLASVTAGAYAAGSTPVVDGGDGTNETYTRDDSSFFLGGRAEFRGDFVGTDTGDDITKQGGCWFEIHVLIPEWNH
ncbi:TPA: hypothetical protein ACN37W_004312 [Vibrio parahaemolyticus]